jgi:ribA/ribD-fused uncharacterized protein
MEALLSKGVLDTLTELIDIGLNDERAELEIKVLPGDIQTKDVADRIVRAIQENVGVSHREEHRATFSYPDGRRVNIDGADNIFKLCTTGSFRGLPVRTERKTRYFETSSRGSRGAAGPREVDMLDIPDIKVRATLRREVPMGNDFSGAPLDPAAHVRILHRKSWRTLDGLLSIDMSLVKTRNKSHKTFSDILKQTPTFELEVEVVNKKVKDKATILRSMLNHVEMLLAAYQQSPFLLSQPDLQRYTVELAPTMGLFINPVTLSRSHLNPTRPHNILRGYTVTNKADGERCFLVVMRDKRLLRVTPSGVIAWTGLTARKDTHVGDVVDGEYLAHLNLFCIFDIYHFRGTDVRRLPLMTTDEDVIKNPMKSRLGCGREFASDLLKDFNVAPSSTPLRVESKLFLAGEGSSMEEAIQRVLDTKFEYPTDGLIFTPRNSPVGPPGEMMGKTWTSVYKWKPASQNSIDFLVRFTPRETYDTVLDARVFRGVLYVSRNPGKDIIYPCETITGEYQSPKFPDELRIRSEAQDLVPSPFQPSVPRDPEAFNILLPLNERGVPVDEEGNRVEDNTIIECARDVENGRWTVMRTRYDKTYQYRVKGRPQYGNYQTVADSIWTSIHVPVTEEMIRNVASIPVDDTFEDDLYYRDALEARDRVLKDVYAFHNRVKETLYQKSIKPGDTLLELAVGRAGDLHKWRKTQPSKIVGIDLSEGNLTSPRQGACTRYLNEKKNVGDVKLPPALFVAGDMTKPLLEQDSKYLKILAGTEPATTPYLEMFAGLTEFDAISCQFAIHYACESEETFQVFADNLDKHGKGVFFGTCMDGSAVYSLLMGKDSHTFRSGPQVFGEFTKQYSDGDGWTEEFGKTIVVALESFEKPVKEYLVPFGRITEILGERGYELADTSMFEESYANQNRFVFTQEQQSFSFLHRSFIFKRVSKKQKKEEVQEVVVPVMPKEPEPEKEKKPVKRKTIKVKEPEPEKEKVPEQKTVFFFMGNPSLTETRFLSNMYESPFEVDGIKFPTVEHWFQWSKAKMFGDEDIATKILKSASPKSAKAYGKKVKDFKPDEWETKKDETMRKGVRAKFVQNADIRNKLIETGDAILAEADPRGKYWGIGTSAGTSKAVPGKWPGVNMMGKILMELRAEFKAESAGA